MPSGKMGADEFLAMAEDAEKQALRTTDENEKARWREIAQGYRDLADASKNFHNPKAN